MYDIAAIVRRALKLGLEPVLEELRALDRTLRSRSPHVQLALARDGHLLPTHRRMAALCRRLAFAVQPARPAARELSRWLLLHSGELAAAAARAAVPQGDETALLEAAFAVELWVGLRLGLLRHLRTGLPPQRKTDLEFYEHRDADHRRISGYAGDLSRIRGLLLELAGAAGCLPGIEGRLDFDPLEPAAALGTCRDRLLKVLAELVRALQPAQRSGVCAAIEASRAALLTPASPPATLPGDFLAVLAARPPAAAALAGLVTAALVQGAAQGQLPCWAPAAARRRSLTGALERLAVGDCSQPIDLPRLRLEVLELADQADPEAPRPRTAWLRLYGALMLLDRGGACGQPPAAPSAAERCARLLDQVSPPPRLNAPEAPAFRRALLELRELLAREAATLPEGQLRRIAGLEDVCEEVAFYLKDDPRYDAGHDWVQADYAPLRAAAAAELSRRGAASAGGAVS